MKIHYIAQSGFIIEDNGIRIGIDLWLDNPVNPQEIRTLPKFDYLFCTHDHSDHGLSDMIALAKRDDATFVGIFEVADFASANGVNKIVGGNIGSEIDVHGIKAFMTPADHSSSLGSPVGFIIILGNTVLFHMGDTGYYDPKHIQELYDIDVLFIPIGGHFTMGPREASLEVRDLKPKTVIPMHYNTFSLINQNPEEFKALVQEVSDARVEILIPGGELIF